MLADILAGLAGRKQQPMSAAEQARALSRLEQGRTGALGAARRDTQSFMQHKPVQAADMTVGDIARFGMDMTPFVGDAIAIDDAKRLKQEGRPIAATLSALSALPVVGDITTIAKMGAPIAAGAASIGGLMARKADNVSDLARMLPKQRGSVGGASGQQGADKTTLYHGSPSPINAIDDRFPFGGVFASYSKESALSHGDALHRVDLPDESVLTQRAIDYDLNPASVLAALKGSARWMSDEDVDIAYDFVVGDKDLFDGDINQEVLTRIFKADDIGEAAWEAQRLRGEVAKRLGFKAVEMSDEHGTSHLVLPGVPISPE